MFARATTLDKNIYNWNVSSVKNMSLMFEDAKNFNQDISGWERNEAQAEAEPEAEAEAVEPGFFQKQGRIPCSYFGNNALALKYEDIKEVIGDIAGINDMNKAELYQEIIDNWVGLILSKITMAPQQRLQVILIV